MKSSAISIFGVLGVLVFSGPAKTGPQSIQDGRCGIQAPAAGARVDLDYGKLPVYFIPNRGQLDERVAYYVQGGDKVIYFTAGGLTLALDQPGAPAGGAGRWTVKLDFVGADPEAKPVAQDETGGIISYFKGNPGDWRTGLPTYAKIVYRDLWPGIDLAYYGTVKKLKYEFIVHPGADPAKIRLAYRGAEQIRVDAEGRLQIKVPGGGFSDDVPMAYQDDGGQRVEVPLAYRLDAIGRKGRPGLSDSGARGPAQVDPVPAVHSYGFEIGEYDRTQTLVLDPAFLVYCGFIGGSDGDFAYGLAADGAGNAFVAGETTSTSATFPEKVGPDISFNGGLDAFVAKIDAAGATLLYCGYIGGADNDWAYGVAVDGSGNAYVTGKTYSGEATFPEVIGPAKTYGGAADAFVAKVNPAGTSLVYCGYIGGNANDWGNGIAVDGSGNAYVTGLTGSTQDTFPVAIGPDMTHNGNNDVFVAKVSAAGTLVYCGYIGGSDTDVGNAIAVSPSGNAYITGYTRSPESTFPETAGPDLTYNGGTIVGGDAFVAQVNASGTALAYCGYVGGSGQDYGNGIAVDRLGNAYLTGDTTSTQATFPVVVGPDLSSNGSTDAFVAKVIPSGTALAYCGFIGGGSEDSGAGIAVDGSGDAFVTGSAHSNESLFPVVAGPDLTHNGFYDAFLAKVSASGKALVYCGYIGGSGDEHGVGIALDRSGNAYVTGDTFSTEATFPTLTGPDLTQNGSSDAFVAKVGYFEQPVQRHAVGDFDGDGADEFVIDFGASGAWMWNGGVWGQLSAINPGNMIALNSDGDAARELALDTDSQLLLWNSGYWDQLGPINAEYLITADTDDNGIDELIIDLGAGGLKWRQEDGYLYGLTGMDPQNIIAVDTDQDECEEVIADFGAMGLWACDRGSWAQLTGADANALTGLDTVGIGKTGLVAGLGGLGTWLWDAGSWTQLSGVRSDRLVAGPMVAGGGEEIAGDFGLVGLWLWSGGGWSQLSGVNADELAVIDSDGNWVLDLAVDFGSLGLWLYSAGGWSQLSGVDPEALLAVNTDGNSSTELVADFGTLGVWLWNGGSWSQISALNPD